MRTRKDLKRHYAGESPSCGVVAMLYLPYCIAGGEDPEISISGFETTRKSRTRRAERAAIYLRNLCRIPRYANAILMTTSAEGGRKRDAWRRQSAAADAGLSTTLPVLPNYPSVPCWSRLALDGIDDAFMHNNLAMPSGVFDLVGFSDRDGSGFELPSSYSGIVSPQSSSPSVGVLVATMTTLGHTIKRRQFLRYE